MLMAAQYITEVLDSINKDISLLQTTFKKVGNGGPLGVIFFHNFEENGKFLLPEGPPPFNPATEPLGMTNARFILEVRKFNLFTRKELTPKRRELIFVQMCESLHPSETAILLAIKDQTLTELYPNITREAVAAAGFINPIVELVKKNLEPSEDQLQDSQSSLPHPPKKKSTYRYRPKNKNTGGTN